MTIPTALRRILGAVKDGVERLLDPGPPGSPQPVFIPIPVRDSAPRHPR